MDDKELADLLDAQDRLKKRGYRKITCLTCGGSGIEGRDWTMIVCECPQCHGKGYIWKTPNNVRNSTRN